MRRKAVVNRAVALLMSGILVWALSGCRSINYRRGEVVIPVGQYRSTIQSNLPAADTDGLTGYAYPGDARSLRQEGEWFKDGYGRYVLFRGVNLDSEAKIGPLYLPLKINSYADFNSESNRVAPCLDALQSLGFNVVRLVVMWKALEPSPESRPSEAYLRALESFVESLYRRGLFVFIDFHQDIASDRYGGDGFPDWALFVDGRHPLRGRPPGPSSNWYFRYEDVWPPFNSWLDPHWPWEVPLNRVVRKTQRSFWENSCDNVLWHLKGYPTQSAFVHAVGQVASLWKTNPAVIGYEPFNEPNDCGIDRAIFESSYLSSFYTNVWHEVREVDRDTNSFIFVEPRTDWNIHSTNASERGLCFIRGGSQIHTFLGEGAPESFVSPGQTNDAEKGVFSFHFYDSWTALRAGLGSADRMENKEREWPGIFQAMIGAATNRNLIPFLTEFGPQNSWRSFPTDIKRGVYDTEDRAYLDLGLRQIERNLLDSTLWCYDFYAADPPQGDNWNHEGFSLLARVNQNSWTIRNADIIARPYPLRSSARPQLLYFDVKSRHAAVILVGKPVEAPTMIYIPRNIQFTNQFEVAATSASLRWDDQEQILYWKPNPLLTTNQVVISPLGQFNAEELPLEARRLMNVTTNHLWCLP